MLAGLSDPATFWLTLTNIILGATVAACLLLVLGGVAASLVVRLRMRMRASSATELHALHVPGLGLTMADGGEPIDPPKSDER